MIIQKYCLVQNGQSALGLCLERGVLSLTTVIPKVFWASLFVVLNRSSEFWNSLSDFSLADLTGRINLPEDHIIGNLEYNGEPETLPL